MQKFFGFALVAGLASFLAVIYTLLSIDWEERPGVNGQAPAVAAPVDPAQGPRDARR
jgi:hypothetical protein